MKTISLIFLVLVIYVACKSTDERKPPAVVIMAAATSDDFCESSIDGKWTEKDPAGLGSFYTQGDTVLVIDKTSTGTADMWSSNGDGLRLLQSTGNDAFTYIIKTHTVPNANYKAVGFWVRLSSDDHFHRFDIVYSSNLRLFAATVNGTATPTTHFNTGISASGPVWLKLVYDGVDSFTATYSTDGSSFSGGGSWTDGTTVTGVGPWAGNGGTATFQALIDFFSNESSAVNGDESSCAASGGGVYWQVI